MSFNEMSQAIGYTIMILGLIGIGTIIILLILECIKNVNCRLCIQRL